MHTFIHPTSLTEVGRWHRQKLHVRFSHQCVCICVRVSVDYDDTHYLTLLPPILSLSSSVPTPGHYSTGTDRKFTLLEEVFRKFPKMPVNIEIKEDNSLLMEKVQD